MEHLIQDARHAFRLLRRSPGFALTAVAALALGIGANTAIFSVVNTVLLKPLPFPHPERIVQLMLSSPQGRGNVTNVPKYIMWRGMTDVFDEVAAYDLGGPGINLTGGDRPEQVKGIRASREYFALFGVPMALGRSFSAEEDRPGGGRVVVISTGVWQRRFGGDPNAIGKTLLLGGEPYTVIGVAGAVLSPQPPPDLWLP